jgi:hypothetical protein
MGVADMTVISSIGCGMNPYVRPLLHTEQDIRSDRSRYISINEQGP